MPFSGLHFRSRSSVEGEINNKQCEGEINKQTNTSAQDHPIKSNGRNKLLPPRNFCHCTAFPRKVLPPDANQIMLTHIAVLRQISINAGGGRGQSLIITNYSPIISVADLSGQDSFPRAKMSRVWNESMIIFSEGNVFIERFSSTHYVASMYGILLSLSLSGRLIKA